MQLECKPDLDRSLERFEAWWDGQIIDRPPVTIYTPSGRDVKTPDKTHATLRDRWLDVEYNVAAFEASIAGELFLGDTFPMFFPNVGPEVCATLFGCELEFGETTSWSQPVAASCREILKIQPNFENVYWHTLGELTDLSLQRGAGKWLTGIPDLHMDGDLLAALRDPQEVCLEFYDDIDAIRAACEYTNTFYATIYDELYNRITATGQPCTTWATYLHSGRAYVTSCDLICMISPEMLERTIMPSIREQMGWLDRNMFHLDGPGALKHLDTMLACKDLDALQWVYGDGNEPAAKWAEVYQKAQSAGKSIQIYAVDINDAKALAEHIKPEGAWFQVGGSHTRAETEDFLRWAERWAAGKKV